MIVTSVARRAARVQTISQFSAGRIAELSGRPLDQIEVGYPGVDPRFSPTPRPTRPWPATISSAGPMC